VGGAGPGPGPPGVLPHAGDVGEAAPGLPARGVRGGRQSDLPAEPVPAPVLGKVVADLGGPRVLAHDGVVDRLSRGLLPYHGGLALVRDAHRREIARLDLGLLQAPGDDILGALPDLHRFVLDQPGLRIDLLVLLLVDPDHLAAVVEDHEPRAGRTLVERSCILRHGASLSSSSPSYASLSSHVSAAVFSRRYVDVAPGS